MGVFSWRGYVGLLSTKTPRSDCRIAFGLFRSVEGVGPSRKAPSQWNGTIESPRHHPNQVVNPGIGRMFYISFRLPCSYSPLIMDSEPGDNYPLVRRNQLDIVELGVIMY